MKNTLKNNVIFVISAIFSIFTGSLIVGLSTVIDGVIIGIVFFIFGFFVNELLAKWNTQSISDIEEQITTKEGEMPNEKKIQLGALDHLYISFCGLIPAVGIGLTFSLGTTVTTTVGAGVTAFILWYVIIRIFLDQVASNPFFKPKTNNKGGMK